MSMLFDCREAFAERLEQLARQDARVFAVTNDSISSSKLDGFQVQFPERLINVGIAEQNLIGVSAGLALGGQIPFVCGAAPFLSARGLEQIKVDLAYARTNVKVCAMSSGVAYGPLGATHHAIEDLAWMRTLPNMTIIVPADPEETRQAVEFCKASDGPVYLRLSRMPVPAVHGDSYQFTCGKSVRLREGRDLTLIANGTMVSRALAAAEQLSGSGVEARVINMATLAPLDREAIIQAAEETHALVTIEEHTTAGGLGGAVAEVVVSTRPVPMRILGIPRGCLPRQGRRPGCWNTSG